MMPLAFPEVDWRGINDWDQQFMLGDALLVAPAAFYVSIRSIHLPPGRWYDTLARRWVDGGCAVVHEVDLGAIPVFLRAGSALRLHPRPEAPEVWVVHALDPEAGPGGAAAAGPACVQPGAPAERHWRLSDDGTPHHWLGSLAEIVPLSPSIPS
jgi:hypothetical protein